MIYFRKKSFENFFFFFFQFFVAEEFFCAHLIFLQVNNHSNRIISKQTSGDISMTICKNWTLKFLEFLMINLFLILKGVGFLLKLQ